MIELMTQNGSTLYTPCVEDSIQLTLQRQGTPGKLSFKAVRDGAYQVQEGNPVRLTVDGTKVFYGFVFSRRQDQGNTIEVTAYDQLRYLKNKDTIAYGGCSAAQLVRRLARDYALQCGTLDDTGYVLDSTVEKDQTLFDIIGNALDNTLMATGRLYVLYDDFGKICLRDIESMRLGLLIDAQTGESFEYNSSIDEETYNRVKLSYDNEKTGKREIYIAQDSSHQNDWGLLQYYEELNSPTGAAAKANALLSYYNRKTLKLSVKSALGHPGVKAGTSVAVALDLGDTKVSQFMVVDQVTHTFSGSQHLMDLELIGGDFGA